jgi:hypothetical protein
MRELAVAPSLPSLSLPLGAWPRWAHAAGGALLVAAAAVLFTQHTPPRLDGTHEAAQVFLRPISELTPGATRPVAVSELCGAEQDRPASISAALHEEVFKSYGADIRRAADYELDYLITPELGGATDVRNLWPQAYSHTPWNALVKDELERFLYRRVCDGALDLPTAQRQMATDWIAAYKVYFETDKPLRDYVAQPLTSLDREMLVAELDELGVAPFPVGADGESLLVLLDGARQNAIAQLVGRSNVSFSDSPEQWRDNVRSRPLLLAYVDSRGGNRIRDTSPAGGTRRHRPPSR